MKLVAHSSVGIKLIAPFKVLRVADWSSVVSIILVFAFMYSVGSDSLTLLPHIMVAAIVFGLSPIVTLLITRKEIKPIQLLGLIVGIAFICILKFAA